MRPLQSRVAGSAVNRHMKLDPYDAAPQSDRRTFAGKLLVSSALHFRPSRQGAFPAILAEVCILALSGYRGGHALALCGHGRLRRALPGDYGRRQLAPGLKPCSLETYLSNLI